MGVFARWVVGFRVYARGVFAFWCLRFLGVGALVGWWDVLCPAAPPFFCLGLLACVLTLWRVGLLVCAWFCVPDGRMAVR